MYTLEDKIKIDKQWENFIHTGNIGENNVKDLIYQSWQRSLRNKVNPIKNKVSYVSKESFEKKVEECRDFIKAAVPYMRNLYDSFKGDGFTVIIADKSCCILEVIGEREDIERVKVHNKAALCREDLIGTNGIGTSIYLDKPVQIWAGEHFSKGNHILSCSAAPVHDFDGRLIGCLSVSCYWEDANPHIISTVTAAANAIERQLLIERELKEKAYLIAQQEVAFENISEGILTLDKNINIIGINNKALQFLCIKNKKDCIGRKIENFVLEGLDLDYVRDIKNNISETEITLKLSTYKSINCIVSISIVKQNKDINGFIIIIKEAKEVHKLVNKIIGAKAYFNFNDILRRSKIMENVVDISKTAAKSFSNVLIVGESGTGKELIAHSIHNASERKDNPFIAINCASIPGGLIESELFGYEGGSFTGSKKEGNPGKFELADGGTIFLDEIGDMPLEVQATLLRVVQSREVYRIGGNVPKKIDVRIIAATNRNLEEMLSENNFRLDLYYRINVLNINVPPLRERKEDILILSENFVRHFSKKLRKNIKGLTKNAEEILLQYDWPGNVRELSNVMERAVNICRSDYLDSVNFQEKIIINKSYNESCYNMILKEKEKTIIIEKLREYNGNLKKTAEVLNFSRSTLYRKIASLNIDYSNYRMKK